MQYTLSEIKRTLKAVGKPILDRIGSVFDNEVKKVNTGNTNSKDNNIETPPEKNEQKRTDSGNSTHIVALQFTEALLHK
ncbi:hypothetical protein KPC_3852 [Acinetobacter stercoris]|uniref:Uncharacterized protein n=1 Tax=Acinetobacter stercoris TaxID=2126983 RepID=A0A2U3N4V3_9GAMM|nr:hypothetical protein KPC_3852 [Acinetobacter stercoris]